MNDETAARDLVRILDGLRTRYGFALLTEAHPGHAEDGAGERRMRPAGSSLFLRWPEFGFGLRRAKEAQGHHPDLVDVVAWRGSREQRSWPRQLKHGSPNGLPWEPAHSDYYQEAAA
jgi:replicative DNA helicase